MTTPTIFDAFDAEKFELTKLLASYLWVQDILNLSSTCSTFRTVFWTGPSPSSTPGFLLRYAQSCDGSSGKAWKQICLERLEAYHTRDQSSVIPSEEAKAKLLKRLDENSPCSALTNGRNSSKHCMICRAPVCENCRAKSSYSMNLSGALESAITDAFGDMSTDPFPFQFRSDNTYESTFGYKPIFRNRWISYCHNCENKAITGAPTLSFGDKLLECKCVKREDDNPEPKIWICVPCFQQPVRARYVCANRRRVAGCLGVSAGKILFCQFCGHCVSREPSLGLSRVLSLRMRKGRGA